MTLIVTTTFVSQFITLFLSFAVNAGLIYFSVILFRRIARI